MNVSLLNKPRLVALAPWVRRGGVVFFLLGIGHSYATAAGFEAPEFSANTPVTADVGWIKEGAGSATITNEQSVDGQQSLKIEGQVKLQSAIAVAPSASVYFVDFWLLPTFEAESPVRLRVGGARLELFAKSNEGTIRVFRDEDPEGEVVSSTSYTFDENGLSFDWIRVTLRVDDLKKEWDLYLDGLPAKAKMSLGEGSHLFEEVQSSKQLTFLDSLSTPAQNPLFEDVDQDGMPDAEERGLGLLPNQDDRDGDSDGDGISNIDEVFAHTQRSAFSSSLNSQTIFVDNLNGNDTNSGARAYALADSSGPKASIKSAMSVATDGDVIVVLKGTGLYQEGSRGSQGKKLIIRAVEPVTIE